MRLFSMEGLYVAPQAPLHNEEEIVWVKLWGQEINVHDV